jgi:hypothetical protein
MCGHEEEGAGVTAQDALDYPLMAAAVAKVAPGWGVKGYRSRRSRDGVAYSATLTFEGNLVGWIEDTGNGGGPRVTFRDGWKTPMAFAFGEEANRLFPETGLAGEMLVEAILQRSGK